MIYRLIIAYPIEYPNFIFFKKDALSYKDHPNLKIVWYEDLSTNFENEVESLSDFTGYKMTEETIKVNNFNVMYGRP